MTPAIRCSSPSRVSLTVSVLPTFPLHLLSLVYVSVFLHTPSLNDLLYCLSSFRLIPSNSPCPIHDSLFSVHGGINKAWYEPLSSGGCPLCPGKKPSVLRYSISLALNDTFHHCVLSSQSSRCSQTACAFPSSSSHTHTTILVLLVLLNTSPRLVCLTSDPHLPHHHLLRMTPSTCAVPVPSPGQLPHSALSWADAVRVNLP